jgi:hypothetical protein
MPYFSAISRLKIIGGAQFREKMGGEPSGRCDHLGGFFDGYIRLREDAECRVHDKLEAPDSSALVEGFGLARRVGLFARNIRLTMNKIIIIKVEEGASNFSETRRASS